MGLVATAHAATYNVNMSWKDGTSARTQMVVVADDSKPAFSAEKTAIRLLVDTSTIPKAEFDAMGTLNKLPVGLVSKCDAVVCSYGVPQEFTAGQSLEVKARVEGDNTLFDLNLSSDKLDGSVKVSGVGSLLPLDLPRISHQQISQTISIVGDHGKFTFPAEGGEPLVIEVTKVQN